MPYIEQKDRIKYDAMMKLCPEISTKGELEYLIFSLMKEYMVGKQWKYTTLHDTVYAAMHCADEYRRRYLDEREDQAILNNGDI